MEQTAILALIEGDLNLIFRLQELCTDYGFRLSVARRPEEAILYLRGVGIYGNRFRYPMPGLVLLDTEGGGAADLMLLAWLREDPTFKNLPVVVLANEPPHQARVACAIDPQCFVIDRHSLWELPSLAWQICFPPHPELKGSGPL